jgi:Spy/CpxP family protein refolding chaperone
VKHIDEGTEYMPSRLFDLICKQHELKTDRELAHLLGIGSPQTCRVRHRLQPLSGQLLIRIHEVTGMQIQQLKVLMGDRRSQHRTSRAKLGDVQSLRAAKPSDQNVSPDAECRQEYTDAINPLGS